MDFEISSLFMPIIAFEEIYADPTLGEWAVVFVIEVGAPGGKVWAALNRWRNRFYPGCTWWIAVHMEGENEYAEMESVIIVNFDRIVRNA